MSFIIGYAVLKRGVKGAYFAILTQAMAVAFATLLVATIKQTGGFNGLNTFTKFFGQNLYDPAVKKNIYMIAASLLIVCLLVVWQLYRSRYGELLVATRDAEARIRFLGYDPANIKLVAFVVAAIMASIGGALFAPIAGIISPTSVDATASIMLIAGVALGGRASLFGPAIGAIAVGFGQSYSVRAVPEQLGLLPGCVVHRGRPVVARWRGLARIEAEGTPAAPAVRVEHDGARNRNGGGGVTPPLAWNIGKDYLEVRDLTVDFGGFKAIDGVDLTLLQGRLHFLIGPNGAGKTTLVDALTGLVKGTGKRAVRQPRSAVDEVA